MPSVVELYRYPLKSGMPESLKHAEVERRGFRGDRRWILIDQHNRFVSAREHAALVRVRAELGEDVLVLHFEDGAAALEIPVPKRENAEPTQVSIWSDHVDALLADSASCQALSTRLGRSLRLAYMDEHARRSVDAKYAQPFDEVSFADGYPVLVLSSAAVAQLNERASEPVSALNFRPNIVLGDCPPHAEDQWQRIAVGEVEFELVKPCVRCVLTTVDPARGERLASGEPLRSLKEYRRSERGITFGMNAIARSFGRIELGAAIQVLQERT
jgi:hypothetical protein